MIKIPAETIKKRTYSYFYSEFEIDNLKISIAFDLSLTYLFEGPEQYKGSRPYYLSPYRLFYCKSDDLTPDLLGTAKITRRKNLTRLMMIYRDYLRKSKIHFPLARIESLDMKERSMKIEDDKVIFNFPAGLYKLFYNGKGFNPIWEKYNDPKTKKDSYKDIEAFIDKYLIFKPEGFTLYADKKDFENHYLEWRLAG